MLTPVRAVRGTLSALADPKAVLLLPDLQLLRGRHLRDAGAGLLLSRPAEIAAIKKSTFTRRAGGHG
ncbi:MAG: hypothetical protein M0C28_22820 [Candidatus Moduliflexus flocculans]|nr:hypothetical protein [Candidatus Moduliflexus flocculans]